MCIYFIQDAVDLFLEFASISKVYPKTPGLGLVRLFAGKPFGWLNVGSAKRKVFVENVFYEDTPAEHATQVS